jgi:4-amino-4-deoxy-L-arabinose transferase-like glycosyltransferase
MSLTRMSERQQTLALMGLCVLLYVPLAGHYGLWDPWETHYGEIARQMAQRNDWISLWWPCSPVDRAEVFHKPVLHFWLMALSMKAFGLEWAGAAPSQMVDGWWAEWACRLPNLLLSILAIVAIFKFARRLAGGRVAWLAAAILATSSQWVLVTRQAMTDMPFVVPMTVALAWAGLALLTPDEKPLDRRSWRRLSWPRANSFYALLAVAGCVTLPQLAIISIQLRMRLHVGGYLIHTIGLVPMLPYVAAFLVGIWWSSRARTRRQLHLLNAWVWCALATLAKGPAGLALPGLVLVIYLVATGRWRDLIRLELARGALLFVAACFPWYHAMHIRHGMAFWNELIGDNYIHRAQGRHGDRGVFDYYLEWLSYGLFPWSGLAACGALFSFRWLRDEKKRGLAGFALVWLAVDLTVMTLVNTKFHHYILPALPALALLAALFLDELLTAVTRAHLLALVFVALPVTLLAGRDLAQFPARVIWLFCYDYVNMPGTGRPWPSGAQYQYGAALGVFVVAALVALLVLTLTRHRRVALGALVVVALGFSLFVEDKLLVELSPHWSQKQVIETYYRQRRGPEEPLIVWQLYWRGENFYTRNEIYRSPDPEARTVFLEGSANRLAPYLARHSGGRMFFLVERVKLEALRQQLPAAARANLRIIDDSNNKLYLAVAEI